MDARRLDELLAEHASAGRPYLEFVRSGALSAGLYMLRVGEVDRQRPHREDEVYVVVRGRARFSAGDEVRDVNPGDVIFVAAHVPHRFHDIREDLEIVVVFAPPETTSADDPPG